MIKHVILATPPEAYPSIILNDISSQCRSGVFVMIHDGSIYQLLKPFAFKEKLSYYWSKLGTDSIYTSAGRMHWETEIEAVTETKKYFKTAKIYHIENLQDLVKLISENAIT